jgi:hypothetical protein
MAWRSVSIHMYCSYCRNYGELLALHTGLSYMVAPQVPEVRIPFVPRSLAQDLPLLTEAVVTRYHKHARVGV